MPVRELASEKTLHCVFVLFSGGNFVERIVMVSCSYQKGELASQNPSATHSTAFFFPGASETGPSLIASVKGERQDFTGGKGHPAIGKANGKEKKKK